MTDPYDDYTDASNPLPPTEPSPEYGPVYKLLLDPSKWDNERDCSTNKNRLTKPESVICVRWSVRAAVELYYKDEWRTKMRHFMNIANKHYPNRPYNNLHNALSHEAVLFLLKEAQLWHVLSAFNSPF